MRLNLPILHHRDQDRLQEKGKRKKKKKRIHIDCIASFPGQRNMTQRHLTEPAVPPVRKESTSETTMIPLALWVALWQPLL